MIQRFNCNIMQIWPRRTHKTNFAIRYILHTSLSSRTRSRMAPAQVFFDTERHRTIRTRAHYGAACMKYRHQTRRNYVELFALSDEQWPSCSSWNRAHNHRTLSQTFSYKNYILCAYGHNPDHWAVAVACDNISSLKVDSMFCMYHN